jgi:hypothetical protein
LTAAQNGIILFAVETGRESETTHKATGKTVEPYPKKIPCKYACPAFTGMLEIPARLGHVKMMLFMDER